MKKVTRMTSHIHRMIAILLIAMAPSAWSTERIFLQIKSDIEFAEAKSSSKSTSYLAVGTKTEHVINNAQGTPSVTLTITPTAFKHSVLAVDVVLSVKLLVDAKENRFEQRNYLRKENVKFGDVTKADLTDGVRYSWTAKQVTEAEFLEGVKQLSNKAYGAK